MNERYNEDHLAASPRRLADITRDMNTEFDRSIPALRGEAAFTSRARRADIAGF